MKCALPGMYGRKVPIESSFIRDSYLDAMRIDMDPTYNCNQEEIVKNYEEYILKVINSKEDSIYDEIDKNKKNNIEKEYDSLKKYLIEKDKKLNESQN